MNAVTTLRETANLKRALNKLIVVRSRNQLAQYSPYPKQREFHAAGAHFRERLLRAGNQLGKTLSASAEVAMHLTGRYPDWWEGKRFNRAVNGLAGSETGELTRRGVQRYLIGRDLEENLGTGMIPYNTIAGISRARGLSDLVDTITVRHVTDGYSTVSLKSYDQGRRRWQADTVDFVWFDEEPPADIYFEGITRTNVSLGPVMVTFTPLMGMSAVVMRFLEEKFSGTHDTRMGIRDALHYSESQIAEIIASYPAHERQARTEGEPSLGDGAIFPVPDEDIVCDAFAIPDHWPRIVGIDFGWDHPTAGVWIAYDRDNDVIYLTDEHAARQTAVPIHAAAIKGRGEWIPVAWPHDGNNDTAIGANLASQYRAQGLNMLHEHAQFEKLNGSESDSNTSVISVWAGIEEMLTRMMTGRFKVCRNLDGWMREKRLYRRENGKIVKLEDDRISASRYGMMMLRYATTKPVEHAREYKRRGDWRTS